jgi:predicted RNA-binding Zn-ribbon protein involved in translation (DUF1610 family)
MEAHIIANKEKIQTDHFQLARSCAQCFGTEKVFCLWNSCVKAQQSTQVPVAAYLTLSFDFTYRVRLVFKCPTCGFMYIVRQAVSLNSKAHKYGNNNARMVGIELLSSERNKVFLYTI